MSKVTVIPFIDFVRSKPADMVIDHSSWHSCAVGEWVEECQLGWGESEGDPQLTVACRDELKRYVLPLQYRIKAWKITLYDRLNNGNVATYGELLELMESCEVIDV